MNAQSIGREFTARKQNKSADSEHYLLQPVPSVVLNLWWPCGNTHFCLTRVIYDYLTVSIKAFEKIGDVRDSSCFPRKLIG